MEKVALLGGKPILKESYPPSNLIGKEEKDAVMAVLDSGVLSDYVGRAGPFFLGGKKVKALEEAFCKKFGSSYAVSFNSATTALHAAVNALGISPGDEVIVSPFTMSASVTAVLMNGAIPVFADIDEYYCLDPESVKKRISKRTRALMVTNLFGASADYDALLKIAKEHDLRIIEDNAQAPGGKFGGKYTGTIGDIGVFSFNFHKQIHCGEGGVLIASNKDFAYRAQLTRNHGEHVLDDLNDDEPLIGNNYRLPEPLAAIAIEQFKKLDFINKERVVLAKYLSEELGKIRGIEPALVRDGNEHVYYVYPFRVLEDFGVSRDVFAKAMEAEGFPLNAGYIKPMYLLKVFQNKKMFVRTQFPFEGEYFGDVSYAKGLCPNCEERYEKDLCLTTVCRYPLTKKELDAFVLAVKKIQANAKELAGWSPK